MKCFFALFRGIDFAIANNDIPKKVEEFPRLLKQVISRLLEIYGSLTGLIEAIVSVLMIVLVLCDVGVSTWN